MTLREAEVLALSTLKQVMEEKVRRGAVWRGLWAAEKPLGCDRLSWFANHGRCNATCCSRHLLQVTATNVDIARVAPKWHLYTVAEVEEVIGRL